MIRKRDIVMLHAVGALVGAMLWGAAWLMSHGWSFSREWSAGQDSARIELSYPTGDEP